MERQELPTRDQINAISDRSALEDMREDIGRVITKIETDLEFADGDEDWAARARSALSHHRYAVKMIGHRIKYLAEGRANPFSGLASVKTSVRTRSECNPLSVALIDQDPLDMKTLTSEEEVKAALSLLVRQIEALRADREDEVLNFDPGARDEAWLIRSNAALRRAGAARMELLERCAVYRRQAKEAAQKQRDTTRPQLFIDCAREVLDRATFLAIWDRVDRIEPTRTPQVERASSRDAPNPEPTP